MKSRLPSDYEVKVYAGVLGKLIGVYLGRPFEQWSYQAISARWGEIRRYVHQDQNVPLIVTDDDITGTFTFIRALLDHGIRSDLTAREIGQTWLNYIAEGRHILWWGGLGMSAEHTAYLRLAAGTEAPRSGSAELNGPAVAEEIGAQIFIDGWAMVAPGNPDLAVRLAQQAASVSHDGEAIYGALFIAAMESLAFVEQDINRLIDHALTYIPAESRIFRVIGDVRRWHRGEPDWRKARELLVKHHGYECFGTNCPMVSNHGVIILALLYGGGDFDRSMMIVNTCGYDTDCNAANLGCLLGIRNGLDAFQSGYDWRGPVNDRMFLPTAAGHQGVCDAATVALELVNVGRAFAQEAPLKFKEGARYFFTFPGSTHGFASSDLCPRENRLKTGDKVLILEASFDGRRCDAEVPTFLPRDALKMPGYAISATPSLYAGNRIKARVIADSGNASAVGARLFVRAYAHGREDLVLHESDRTEIFPGKDAILEWIAPDTDGWPVASVGVQLDGGAGSRLHLDWLTWDGTPSMTFSTPPPGASRDVWERMFVGSMEHCHWDWNAPFQLIQNRGRGVLHTGAREWRDYRIEARLKPWVAREFALVGRVQGLTRYYGFFFKPGNQMALVRMCHEETVLASGDLAWQWGQAHDVAFELKGNVLIGFVDGRKVIEAQDPESRLEGGGIGFVVSEGRVESGPLRIQALPG